MTAVHIEGLSHSYGKTLALADINLEIAAGSTVGLIGPDGVGKSTLLALIAGVKRLQRGRIHVLGGDLGRRKIRSALAPRIAYMPQGLGRNLYPTLSVQENIDFHGRLFGLNRAERQHRIRQLLEATGLAPFPHRAAGKLSGGMKQKVSLCCALVHTPDLLILDEPTTGVDPLSRRQFWALVNDLRAQRPEMTVIVATAYIDEAQQFEELLAMDAGRLLVSAPTATVLADAGTDNLETAYIRLLPPEKQSDGHGLERTPFVPDPALPPAIVAHGLTKRFGDFCAVDNVSFSIQQGEIFGFLGSNGCGKSTTMKMLTGLLPATAGTGELLGVPVSDTDDMENRLRVGYMSQAFSLYEELTVRQNLELHARLYRLGGRSAALVTAALQQFELAAVATVKPSALPLGLRQRLQLAAACLHRPRVLILDEPTSGVDPAARDGFWRYLLQLSRTERITIFVSTHFMNEAARCDRISFMHRGRVLAVGSPAELVAQYQAPSLEAAFIKYLEEDEARQGEAAAFEGEALPSAVTEATAAPPASGWLHFLKKALRPQNPEGEALPAQNPQANEALPSGNDEAQAEALPAENLRPNEALPVKNSSVSRNDDRAARPGEALRPASPQSDVERNRAAPTEALPSGNDGAPAEALRSEKPQSGVELNKAAPTEALRPETPSRAEALPSGNDEGRAEALPSGNDEGQAEALPSGNDEGQAEALRSGKPQSGVELNKALPTEALRSQEGGALQSETADGIEALPAPGEALPPAGREPAARPGSPGIALPAYRPAPAPAGLGYWFAMVGSFASRELKEFLRDRVRLFFALFGPVLLLIALGFGMSFDVRDLDFTVLDHDGSQASRALVEPFRGSPYFRQRESDGRLSSGPAATPAPEAHEGFSARARDDEANAAIAMQRGLVQLIIDIPPGYGAQLQRGNRPEVGFFIDGSQPFTASNISGYVQALVSGYARELLGDRLPPNPAELELRYRYNQQFDSVFAVVPGVLMLALILFPATLSVVGVVREREIGSIANFITSPAGKGQFLLGKQLPYILISYLAFLELLVLMLTAFGLSLKGSLLALLLGSLLMLCASTAFGLLISCFVRSQVAAIVTTAVVSIVPVMSFSGFIFPLESLAGTGFPYFMGKAMPASWFLRISIGTFTKGLTLWELREEMAVLLGLALVYLGLAQLILKKQER